MPNTAGQEKEKKILTREIILKAALADMDEAGIDALSMRSIGKKLGVEAMSLYNHVKNKDDLIDGALDMVAAEITLPGPDIPWRQAMEVRARSALHVFKRHPWASALMDSRLSFQPARMGYFDRMLGTLHQAGFSLETAARAFSVLDCFVYGFGLQLSNMVSGGQPDAQARAAAFYQNMTYEQYPNLFRMSELASTAPYDEQSDFEFGLALILDGLERVLSSAKTKDQQNG